MVQFLCSLCLECVIFFIEVYYIHEIVKAINSTFPLLPHTYVDTFPVILIRSYN